MRKVIERILIICIVASTIVLEISPWNGKHTRFGKAHEEIKPDHQDPDSDSTWGQLMVEISDIDSHKRSTEIRIVVTISKFPHVVPKVQVNLVGGGLARILCQNTQNAPDFRQYKGESEKIDWFLEGNGEAFPFENYFLNFTLDFVSMIPEENLSFSRDNIIVVMSGPKSLFLRDNWQLGKVEILQESCTRIIVNIERSPHTKLLLYLEFLLPIALCYYLLGATLIMRSDQLRERLRIGLSIFAFVFTFQFAIQPYLPYRSSASFPEVLLINLLVSDFFVQVLVVMRYVISEKRGKAIQAFNLLFLSSFVLLYSFLFIFVYGLLGVGKIGPVNTLITFCVFPTYVYGYAFRRYFANASRSPKTLVTFLILFLLPLLLLTLMIPYLTLMRIV